MAFGMASEYAVAALLVALAVWKLATNEGLDAFVWGFAMLWFTGIALAGLHAFLIAMLAAFTVCLALWTMIVVRRNGRERHHLERLKRELADL